jgi:hypothetical protein
MKNVEWRQIHTNHARKQNVKSKKERSKAREVLLVHLIPRVFFLDLDFLPEGTDIIGYREISEIPPNYRTNFFKQILKIQKNLRQNK